MKTKLLLFGNLFSRAMIIASFCLLTGFNLSAQNFNHDFHDGRVYLKYKDNVVPDFSVRADNTVDINSIPFISALGKEFRLKALSRPFYLNNDSKLIRTLMLEFDDFDKVDQIISRLNEVPELEYVERVPYDRIFSVPNDTLYTLYSGLQNWNWHLDRIQAAQAWEISQGSPDIKVAIVDNAIWVDHPDLAGKVVAQRDTYYNTNNPNPPASGDPFEWSHGTHCAGLAAAITNNGIGVASVGYNVSIIAVKAAANTSANGIYGFPGIQWAANNGADVINMSWGGVGYSQTNQNLINTIYNSGVVLVAAAGNENVSTPHYPSSYANVISVASTDYDDVKSDFSNFAASVDVCAPGGSCSPGPAGLLSTTFSSGTFGNYDLMEGTSMASPVVAGLAGLILSINPLLTPAQVEIILKSTADNIYSINPDYTGMLGAGRINAYQAALNTPFQPTANLTTAVTTILPGGSGINYSDLSTGVPSQWSWTFEGANPAVSSDKNPFGIRYNTAGIYDVSLTATNAFGSSTIDFPDYITVTSSPVPYIFISASDSMPCISSPVVLSDASLYSPTSWEWAIAPSSYELLNGTGLNSQNPEVKFMVPGLYSVNLTASNGNGSSYLNMTDFIHARGAVPFYTLDMEDGSSGYFDLWDTIKSQSAVDKFGAKQSSFGIHFHGDPLPTGWKGSPTAGTAAQAWVENRQFHGEAAICGVDATGMGNIGLDLDIRQTYSLGPRFSWFRVLVNGVQVSDDQGIADFNPLTAGGDPWQRLTFDLTPWAGTVFDITLQSCTRFSNKLQGQGDNVFIDNISISNTTSVQPIASQKPELRVFPNPSNGQFNVSVANTKGNLDITVISMLGNVVYSTGKVQANSLFTRNINLSSLPAGIYLLLVKSEDTQMNQRIVIR